MRRMVILVLVALVLSATACAALEIGLGAGYRYQYSVLTDFTDSLPLQEHGVYLDVRAWPFPLQLGIGITRVIIGPSVTATSFVNGILTADYWLLDFPLGSLPLQLHVGAGAWASVPVFGLGVRGSVGMRLAPIPKHKGFEVSLEVLPTVGAFISPSLGFVAGGSAGLGIRYWFGR